MTEKLGMDANYITRRLKMIEYQLTRLGKYVESHPIRPRKLRNDRVYMSNADRQKAYRARKRVKVVDIDHLSGENQ